MRNKRLNTYQYVISGALTLLFAVVSWLAFVTHANRNLSTVNPFLMYAIDHHLWIMFMLVILSIACGFAWSAVLYTEVKQRKKDTKSILNVVLLFLNTEEKSIINFIVESNGSTTQSEIARLEGMNRVKAFRSLQKMQEKNLIEIVPHGKVRKVLLKDTIKSALENNS